jgi:hypothetical protein
MLWTSFPHQPTKRNMSDKQRTSRWMFIGLLVALLVWAGLLALGAFLQLGADHPRRDLGRPIVVFGSMCVFLALWGWALWLRSQRK